MTDQEIFKYFDFFGNDDVEVRIHTNESDILYYLNDFFCEYPKYKADEKWNIIAYVDENYKYNSSSLDTSQYHSKISTELGENADVYMFKDYDVIIPEISRTYIKYSKKKHRIEIINNSNKMVFLECYRLLRQILCLRLNPRYIAFHASSFVYQSQIIAFIGNKGSGKTTMNMAIIDKLRPEGAYCSNDRLFINLEEKKAIHWPECPAITLQTLNLFDGLKDRINKLENLSFKPHEVFIRHPKLPSKEYIANNVKSKEKIYLLNKQFVSLMNVDIIPYGNFKTFIYLENKDNKECKLVKCDQVEAYNLCIKNMSDFEEFNNWLNLENGYYSFDKCIPSVYKFQRSGNLEKDVIFLADHLGDL